MCTRYVVPLTLLAAIAIAVSASAATYYYAENLGTLGGTSSQAMAINNNGEVTGYSNNGTYTEAFIWSATGGMTGLGCLDTGNQSYGYAINDDGDVAGWSRTTTSSSSKRAMLYDGTMHNLNSIFKDGVMGTQSDARGMNDAGYVVGNGSWNINGGTGGVTLGFIYAPGDTALTDIGTLGGGAQTSGNDINNNNQIVGSSSNGTQIHAFLKNSGETMQDLGTLSGGTSSYAYAINDNGQIVGKSTTLINGTTYTRAFACTSAADMTPLGVLGTGSNSEAWSINIHGDVVGTSQTSGATANAAFLYSGGTMINLNQRIKSSLGWNLTYAYGINDSGQIAGYGSIGGATRAFMLTPATLGDADLDGDVDNSDLGTAFGNYTGAGGTGKNWFSGDFNDDGSVDNSDLGAAFGNYTGTVQSALKMALTDSPTLADLLYDPTTGNVKLDATEAAGGVITNFVLKNAAGGADFNTAATNFPFAGFFKTNLPTEISNTDPMATGFSGVWDLGNICPTGMDEASLAAWLKTATYVGSLGSGVKSFDLFIAEVPEPSTLALLAAGLLGLLAYAWRKRK